jgi:uncharacterized membrane protein YeaQ/YmgE (transglycosylase-associated protein family)
MIENTKSVINLIIGLLSGVIIANMLIKTSPSLSKFSIIITILIGGICGLLGYYIAKLR